MDLLEGLTSLLDKSLLYREPGRDGEPRFRMLSLLREYGLERLEAVGELAASRAAHAASFLALAEEADPRLLGADQKTWLDRLEEEHDNLRAALDWAIEQTSQAETEDDATRVRAGWEMAGRMAGALCRFWIIQGHIGHWLRFIAKVREAPLDVAGDVRAQILFQASWAALAAGDLAQRAKLLEESLRLYRSLVQRSKGDRTLQGGLVAALNGAGHMALSIGDYPTLEHVCEESLALCRQVGERWREAEAMHILALGCARRGEEATGRALCEASLAICRELGDGGGTSIQLLSLGAFAWRQGDTAGAQRYVEESLAASQQSAMPVLIAPCLIWLGIILVARGQPSGAVRLWGAADRVGEPQGGSGQQFFDLPLQREIDPATRAYYAHAESTARSQLGAATFDATWAVGRTLTPDQALVATRAETRPLPQESGRTDHHVPPRL